MYDLQIVVQLQERYSSTAIQRRGTLIVRSTLVDEQRACPANKSYFGNTNKHMIRRGSRNFFQLRSRVFDLDLLSPAGRCIPANFRTLGSNSKILRGWEGDLTFVTGSGRLKFASTNRLLACLACLEVTRLFRRGDISSVRGAGWVVTWIHCVPDLIIGRQNENPFVTYAAHVINEVRYEVRSKLWPHSIFHTSEF